MVAPTSLVPHFERWGGLDYRSNDATRKKWMARDVQNVEFLKNGAISCRRGSKGRASSKGGGGLANYSHQSGDLTVEEEVTIDQNLWRLKSGSFTVTYSGVADNPSFAIYPVLTGAVYSFVCSVMEGNSEVLHLDLGVGKDEASPVTVAALIAAVDALANFACTGTGTLTGPAAFVPNVQDGVTSPLIVGFEYWEQVYSPVSNPFATFWADLGLDGFENACLQNSGDRLFIACGHGPLKKYDGNSVYNAGMPCAGIDTKYVAAITGTTVATGLTGTFSWMVTYEMWDAQGKIVEGDYSNVITQVLANQKGRITIPMIQPTSGFLTSCAVASNGGTATGATIAVTAGHTLQVGQYAYFHDNAGAEWRSLISARDNTHITIADSVTIANGAVISAGIRVNLWRTKNGAPSDFFLQGTYACNSGVATLVIDDNTADGSLGAQYLAPQAGHGLPPENLRYLTVYGGSLVGSDGSDVISYSDIDDLEYFATLTAFTFNLKSRSSQRVSGLGANRDIMIVCKENETHVIQGTLYDGKYKKSLLGDAVGTTSHFSIVDAAGYLWFYNSHHGPVRVVGNQVPDRVGYRIQPIVRKRGLLGTAVFSHRRVIGVVHPTEEFAIFYMPVESGGHATTDSIALVADFRDQDSVDREYDANGRITLEIPRIYWSKWTNVEMSGGATFYQDNLVWSCRHYSDLLAAYEFPLVGRQEQGTQYDFADFAAPIPWDYEAGWDDIEAPDILKVINSAIIYSLPEEATSFSFNVSAEFDYANGITKFQKTIAFGQGGVSSGWSTWTWGFVAWGEGAEVKRLFECGPRRATAIKLVFSANVWLQQPMICGWLFAAVPAFKPKALK